MIDLPKSESEIPAGMYRDQDAMSERALFVIDPEGVITWSYVSPISVNPGADGMLRALDLMQARVSR